MHRDYKDNSLPNRYETPAIFVPEFADQNRTNHNDYPADDRRNENQS